MSLTQKHEIHSRRFSRNLGVGLTLVALIGIVFGLTFVKVTRGDFEVPRAGNVTMDTGDTGVQGTAAQGTEAN